MILSACRTPIGAFGGALKDCPPATSVRWQSARRLVAPVCVEPAPSDDVIMGCVLQGGAGMNVARQAALKAGAPVAVPAETVNRVCGSGLQAVVHAAEAIRLQLQRHVVMAGGTESMSQAPYLLKGSPVGLPDGTCRGVGPDAGRRPDLRDRGCHMGITAEEVAARFGVTREEQDAFAAESQHRAAAAIAAGLFRDEIVPVPVAAEEGRAAIVRRRRAPAPGHHGSRTRRSEAGVREGRDGDRRQRLGDQRWRRGARRHDAARARERGRTPLARIVSFAVTGVEPRSWAWDRSAPFAWR